VWDNSPQPVGTTIRFAPFGSSTYGVCVHRLSTSSDIRTRETLLARFLFFVFYITFRLIYQHRRSDGHSRGKSNISRLKRKDSARSWKSFYRANCKILCEIDRVFFRESIVSIIKKPIVALILRCFLFSSFFRFIIKQLSPSN